MGFNMMSLFTEGVYKVKEFLWEFLAIVPFARSDTDVGWLAVSSLNHAVRCFIVLRSGQHEQGAGGGRFGVWGLHSPPFC